MPEPSPTALDIDEAVVLVHGAGIVPRRDRLRVAHDNDPSTVVGVVSDHGFQPAARQLNLYVPLIDSGPMDVETDQEKFIMTIRSWRAEACFAGGMAAMVLRDPNGGETS